jgi:hypothetical protein
MDTVLEAIVEAFRRVEGGIMAVEGMEEEGMEEVVENSFFDIVQKRNAKPSIIKK